jgi:hypothetical protein
MKLIWSLQCASGKNIVINTSNNKIQEIQHNGKATTSDLTFI